MTTLKKQKSHIMRSFTLLLLISLTAMQIQAQASNRIDSLTALLPTGKDSLDFKINSELVIEYFYKDIEKAKVYIDEEISIAIKNDFKGGLADGYIHKAAYFSNVGNADSTFYYFEKAVAIVEAEKMTSKMATLYTNYGATCSNLGYWNKGLKMLQKSQNVIESTTPDTFMTIRNYSSMGAIQGELKNFELSNAYFDKTYNLALAINNKDEMAWSRMMKGTNLMDMGEVENAKQLFKESLEFYKSVNQEFEIARALANYGHALQQQDSLLAAKEIYTEGKLVSDNMGFADISIEFLERLADINMEIGAHKAAIPLLKKALPMNIEMGSIINQARDHNLLAFCYQEVGNFNLAYENLRSYIVLNDSILSTEKVNAINELETKYQTEKKEQEIKLLEERNKRNALEKKGMIGGIIGLLGLSSALLYAMRQRLIKNRIAKEKVDQELEFNQKELELRKQELTAYALQIAQKNELLEGIKTDVNQITKSSSEGRDLQKIVNTISINQADDDSWEGFRKRFLAVHKNFEKDVKIKYPNVTVNELRIMALLKMQLSSKEIANILNISGEGIKKARYRLRKKLGMVSGESLELLVLDL